MALLATDKAFRKRICFLLALCVSMVFGATLKAESGLCLRTLSYHMVLGVTAQAMLFVACFFLNFFLLSFRLFELLVDSALFILLEAFLLLNWVNQVQVGLVDCSFQVSQLLV